MEQIDNKWLFERAESALKNGEQVKIRLVGQSMYPFLDEQRDILTIAPATSKRLKTGDIVLVNINDNYVLHRIIGKTKYGCYTLQGDANLKQKELVCLDRIIGILTLLERDGTQTIHCTTLKWRINGWIWVKLRFARKGLLKAFSWRRRLKKKISLCTFSEKNTV